jgi:hypothetical protein
MSQKATLDDIKRRYEALKRQYFMALRAGQSYDRETGEPEPSMYDIGIISKSFTEMGVMVPRRPDDPMEFLPNVK